MQCATAPGVVVVNEPICPDRVAISIEEADAVADAIERLPPDSPLVGYVIRAEGIEAQLDAACD